MTARSVGHETCHHRLYYLTCTDYERLLARAGQSCEICGSSAAGQHRGKLVIDHDHAHGQGAVRGLLCSRCNAHMRRIDSEERPLDEWTVNYLAWSHPTWHAAQAAAKDRGETLTAAIERALRRYVADHERTQRRAQTDEQPGEPDQAAD